MVCNRVLVETGLTTDAVVTDWRANVVRRELHRLLEFIAPANTGERKDVFGMMVGFPDLLTGAK